MKLWLFAVLGIAAATACSGSTQVATPAPCQTAGAAGEAGASSCDADGDGHPRPACGGDDCDDTRADIHPGAVDTCDGDDNNCDGVVDENNACDCKYPPAPPSTAFADRVCLSGGWFAMGMALTDPQAADIAYIAVPVHSVFVSPFYLDAYEVTNRRFIECLDANVCTVTAPVAVPDGVWKRGENSTPDTLDRPYWGAGAKDAETFCQWAGGWLPSEAQWERAAAGLGDVAERGKAPRPFPNGQYPPTCEEEWTGDCVGDDKFPLARRVGLLNANPDGIYDLGGNVYEITADLFSMQPYEACPQPCKNPCFGCADKTGGSPELKPDTEPWQWSHVTRGGAIHLNPLLPGGLVFSRSQYRDRASSDADLPDIKSDNRGFRCAYPAKPAQ